MAGLIGQTVESTYDSLLKTVDNLPVNGTSKAISDGEGNVIPMEVSTSGIAFTGNADFTDATVIGLSAGTNGTSGTNGSAGTSGSSGTNGTSGTNGSSGTDGSAGSAGTSGSSGTSAGGAAGLVNGTGISSLKNADTLVANPTQANGNSGIALGSAAKANGAESIAIGEFAEATQTGAVAIGQLAEASATYASAWGRTSAARSDGSVAFGQQALVPTGLPGAIAMGRQVAADTADTTHVRALKIVAPDGGIGGNGIIMLSPNGTAYKLTVSNAGELVIAAV